MTRSGSSLLAAVALVVCGCAAPRAGPVSPLARESAVRVYLVTHGWHTGIVLRRADLPSGLWPEALELPAAEYVEVGWGDRAYYPAPDPGLWLTLRAVLIRTPSVLHVAAFRDPPAEAFPESEIVELALRPGDFERLARYIHEAHVREGDRAASPLGPGLYGESRFYRARGWFHLFETCNVWTARALRAAGLPVRDAITKEGLMSQVRTLPAAVPAPAP